MALGSTKASVAVVGAGYWGKNLVRNFAELDALGAIVDPRESVVAELSRAHHAPGRSFDQICDDPSITGVAIATPAETHAGLAIRALKAGKAVFVEKPIALSESDGEAMVACARETGRPLMVGHLLQYHPAFAALRELVKTGGLGAIRYAYSNRLSLGKIRTEESAFLSFAPHDISMLLALFGEEPVDIQYDGPSFLTKGIGDVGRLNMRFTGGRHAHVFVSWLHPFKEHKLVVVGQTGMAVFEDSAKGADKLRLYRHVIDMAGGPATKSAEPEPIPFGQEEPLKEECRHFLDCSTGKAIPLTDGAEAMRVLRVLTRAEAMSTRV